MGKVVSVLSRPIKNFNVESRAHKVISKEKPLPAPLHKASKKELENLLKGTQMFIKTLLLFFNFASYFRYRKSQFSY